MLKINQFSLGQLEANGYLISDKKNNCLIIDPGDEANFILEKIQKEKLIPQAILATHGHFDHIGAVGEIQLSFDIPFYIAQEDQFLIARLNENAKYFLGFDPHFIKPKNVKYLSIKKFHIQSFTFHVLKTPGHTPGSMCFYFKEQALIFTGDTLFKNGYGRYDFFYSDKNKLFNSLKTIFHLPKETVIYPGHGEKSWIKNEKHLINLV